VIFVEGHDASNVAVEVALTYNDAIANIFTRTSIISTPSKGYPCSGFPQGAYPVFKAYGDRENLFERAKVEIEVMISVKA